MAFIGIKLPKFTINSIASSVKFRFHITSKASSQKHRPSSVLSTFIYLSALLEPLTH